MVPPPARPACQFQRIDGPKEPAAAGRVRLSSGRRGMLKVWRNLSSAQWSSCLSDILHDAVTSGPLAFKSEHSESEACGIYHPYLN